MRRRITFLEAAGDIVGKTQASRGLCSHKQLLSWGGGGKGGTRSMSRQADWGRIDHEGGISRRAYFTPRSPTGLVIEENTRYK